MKYMSIVLGLSLVVGCATASKINSVGIGMTKPEVIHTMGSPDSSKAHASKEILVYFLANTSDDAWVGRKDEYWVILNSGKVTQYGRAGDFGSAETPTTVIIDKRNPSNQ